MFIIGLLLILLEFFVPGGIVGIIGGALIIISLLFAGASIVHMAYSILIAMFIAVIGMVIIMKFFGKKLHVFNKLILTDATTTEEGYVSNKNRIELIGKVGERLLPFDQLELYVLTMNELMQYRMVAILRRKTSRSY